MKTPTMHRVEAESDLLKRDRLEIVSDRLVYNEIR